MSRELHIVGFKVGRETYGVPITSLHEIVRVPEITAVPDAPDYLEGVINLRGKIVSVMDLRKRFGEKQITLRRQNRILVVEHAGGWPADRGLGLRSSEDSRGCRGSSAGGFSGRRTELCDRPRQGRRTPGRAARYEQAAGSGSLQVKNESAEKKAAAKPEARGAAAR